MKSIIFYGTLVVLHKNCIVVKIKSDNYFIFKDSIIEEQERLNKYTTLTEIESVIKNHKKRENLDKEYFIKELPLEQLKENWYVFEYIPTQIKTFFNTTATNTITTLLTVKEDNSDDSEDSDNSDSYDNSDSRYK